MDSEDRRFVFGSLALLIVVLVLLSLSAIDKGAVRATARAECEEVLGRDYKGCLKQVWDRERHSG